MFLFSKVWTKIQLLSWVTEVKFCPSWCMIFNSKGWSLMVTSNVVTVTEVSRIEANVPTKCIYCSVMCHSWCSIPSSLNALYKSKLFPFPCESVLLACSGNIAEDLIEKMSWGFFFLEELSWTVMLDPQSGEANASGIFLELCDFLEWCWQYRYFFIAHFARSQCVCEFLSVSKR